ncbi:MAG: hypothetical protein H6845_01870 [Alphaproteobacteria bacterium]|nr:MAG: hypothetical protein H6845_01870 [Alphaproteobacteria bacterium]
MINSLLVFVACLSCSIVPGSGILAIAQSGGSCDDFVEISDVNHSVQGVVDSEDSIKKELSDALCSKTELANKLAIAQEAEREQISRLSVIEAEGVEAAGLFYGNWSSSIISWRRDLQACHKLEDQVTQLRAQLAQDLIEIGSLKGQNMSLREQYDKQQSENRNNMSQIATLQKALEEADSVALSNTCKLSQANSDLTEREKELSDLKAELDQVNGKWRETEALLEEEMRAKSELISAQDSLQRAKDPLDSDKIALVEQNQSLSAELNSLKDKMQDIEASLFKSEKECSDLTKKLSTSKKTIEALEGKYDAMPWGRRCRALLA